MEASQEGIQARLFIKTYQTILLGDGILSIDQLVLPYTSIEPSLHTKASTKLPDFGAFFYTYLRLPSCMNKVHEIYLGQTDELFIRSHLPINTWTLVEAPARRRKMYYDGTNKLAVYINSVADVNDFITLLTAYYIEWNKIHTILALKGIPKSFAQASEYLGIDSQMWEKLEKVWKNDLYSWFGLIAKSKVEFHVQAMKGAYVDYRKAAQEWFLNIQRVTDYKDFIKRPIYFISSNTHSIVNNITGWVNTLENELLDYVKRKNMAEFLEYWKEVNGTHPGSKEHFLWYILKKYEQDYPKVRKKRVTYEKKLGIEYIEARHFLDVNAQIIPVNQLYKSHLKSKLGSHVLDLKKSSALILNIDYPLGYGAYMVLSTLLFNLSRICGMYVLGKASFFSGGIGDVGLPNFAYDENSGNSYYYNNAFARNDFKEFTNLNIIDNQRVVSSKGTLLHSHEAIREYFSNGFSILEMEDGPYLNAVYEGSYYNRYPKGKEVGLLNAPFDIGIIHYASDTPFTKAVTLATRNLGYEGVEATYASSLAILRRIVKMERKRM